MLLYPVCCYYQFGIDFVAVGCLQNDFVGVGCLGIDFGYFSHGPLMLPYPVC